jgi:hypothetical protein
MGTIEILSSVIVVLVATNGFFLVRHFDRVRDIEKRQERADKDAAVMAKVAEHFEERFAHIEARVNAIYGVLVGPRNDSLKDR